jgi:hypothetical protein
MKPIHNWLIALIALYTCQSVMAEENTYIIDDRSSGTFTASSGNDWRLVTDDVMGGVSIGELEFKTIKERPCLHMQGDVKLDNNGGFVQIALNLSDEAVKEAKNYLGISFDVLGNNEDYNLHLRSDELWFPWQSYRATFNATPQWQSIQIPFSEFKPYRTSTRLDVNELERIGFVAIGREFSADLCVANLRWYR